MPLTHEQLGILTKIGGSDSQEMAIEILAARARIAELERITHQACPCLHTTPCDERCTCVMGGSSSGCKRCCTYGSKEQQKAKAEYLVEGFIKDLSKKILNGFIETIHNPTVEKLNNRINELEQCVHVDEEGIILVNPNVLHKLEEENHLLQGDVLSAENYANELKADLAIEKTSAQKWFNAYHDEVGKLRIRLNNAERLGARMASTIYNVRQKAFTITDHDREVMGELVKEWDNRDVMCDLVKEWDRR